MFTWAFAGVNGAVITVAVEKSAAAARDVIAIRFNMTCLLLRDPPTGNALVTGITQLTPVAFRADRRNSRAHSAAFWPWSGSPEGTGLLEAPASGEGDCGAMDTLTYWNGTWHEGNPAILGPRDHAFWLGSMVFDGGRAFEGCGPDLDLHAERVVRSARALGLKPTKTAKEILDLMHEAVRRFGPKAELYVRPMFWAT